MNKKLKGFGAHNQDKSMIRFLLVGAQAQNQDRITNWHVVRPEKSVEIFGGELMIENDPL